VQEAVCFIVVLKSIKIGLLESKLYKTAKYTRCAWLEEHVRVSLIFAIIVSIMLFTVFTLVYILYFEEFLIRDSRGFMILKNN